MDNIDVEKVMKDFAKETAKYHYKELQHLVREMTFDKAFETLKGFNLNKEDGYFDCNYKSITTTIWRTKFNKCIVSDTVDVWHDDVSSPIFDELPMN